MKSNHLELAMKLKALAVKGVGGEATNAGKLLDDYLKKHNLTLDDLDSDAIKSYLINVGENWMAAKFFFQIVSHVCGDERKVTNLSRRHKSLLSKRYKNIKVKDIVIEYEVTEIEKAEISETFQFYWDELERQNKLFYRAFIYKNNLVSNPDKTKVKNDTEDDDETLKELLKMMRGIKDKPMRKRLNP